MEVATLLKVARPIDALFCERAFQEALPTALNDLLPHHKPTSQSGNSSLTHSTPTSRWPRDSLVPLVQSSRIGRVALKTQNSKFKTDAVGGWKSKFHNPKSKIFTGRAEIRNLSSRNSPIERRFRGPRQRPPAGTTADCGRPPSRQPSIPVREPFLQRNRTRPCLCRPRRSE